jgi:signal transduction histidine kinase/FixJ family two-component response regulator
MSPTMVERFVVCVDDDRDFLKSLEGFLPRLVGEPDECVRHQFLYLNDPRQALSDLDDLVGDGETVAMLITDYQMPTMKGLEFLTEARRRTPDSLRVLLTGHAGTESAIEAINEKLLDKYITKPIYDENEFSLSIRHLLQHFEMRRTIGRQTETIRKLYDFATELHACESLEATLERVARFTADSIEDAWVCVALAENGRIVESTAVGLPQLDPRHYQSFGEREIALVASHALTSVDHVPGIGVALARLEGTSSRQWLQVPIIAEGRRLGLVCCAAREPSPASLESAGATLGYVANTAAMAVHNQMNRVKLERAYVAEKQHAAALDETNQRLQSLDRMKNDFLSFISHELRTPLNFMAALGLLDDTTDAEERRRMIDIARRGYDRLQRFVTLGLEYFDWIGSGLVTGAESIPLDDVAARVVAELRARSDGRSTFECLAPDGSCPVAMRENVAHDLLRILLDNAIKFSDGPATVRVEVARPIAESVTLTVTDLGRGFEPEMAAELFRPFTIAHAKQHREGSALNLAIAAAMAQAHGGRIEARSEGRDRGASFIVTLPRANAATNGSGSDSDSTKTNAA